MKIHIWKKSLPSLFTLGTILCGFLAINKVIEGSSASMMSAAWWIIIAGIFDALDGKVARITRTSSEFGIELDSIADVVSFGVAPAVLIYNFMLYEAGEIGYVVAFLFLAAGAVRLARFNTQATTGEKSHFTGLPIPAAAGIIASYILFTENVWNGLANLDFILALTVLSSLAMVSRFRYSIMPHIGFSNLRDRIMSIWFICHILLIARFPDEVFFPTGVLYLLSGPMRSLSIPAVNYVLHKVDSR